MRHITFLPLLISLALIGCDGSSSPTTDKPDNTDDTSLTDDRDGDGYGADSDCDDENADVYVGAPELCDGVDNDCDGVADNGATSTFYADADGDGAGDDGVTVEECDAPTGYVDLGGDCDDADPEVRPGLRELCDEKDNDCDGEIDEETELSSWFRDADSDSYGDPDDFVDDCVQPEGYVANALDCDDTSILEPVHVSEGGASLPDTGETGVWTDTAFASLPGGMDNPLGSVQEGIDLANVCVHVYEGEYIEDIDFNGKNILVLGVDGAETTILRGSGLGPVVTFSSGETAAAELRALTITDGMGGLVSKSEARECGYTDTCTTYTDTYRGGGIFIDGAGPTLAELRVIANTLPPYSYTELSSSEDLYVYSVGGGAYVANGTPVIIDSYFGENSADEGGGLWLDADSYVSGLHTVFASNDASSGGGVASYGALTLTASAMAFNTASGSGGNYGGAALTVGGGNSTLTNVTLFQNTASGGSAYIGASGTGTLINVIAVTNTAGPILDGEIGSVADVTYSDVYGGTGSNYGSYADLTGTAGNISADPDFDRGGSTWSGTDLHLGAASVAVDAGDPASSYNDADGSRNDMGAYGGPDGTW